MSKDLLNQYSFRVFLEGAEALELGFSRISGLQVGVETTTYQEGGVNDRVHLLRGPIQRGGTLRMERGVYAGEFCPLYVTGTWLPALKPQVYAHPSQKKPGKTYLFSNLIVKSWEVGTMDALEGRIMIDTFEVDYESMLLLPL